MGTHIVDGLQPVNPWEVQQRIISEVTRWRREDIDKMPGGLRVSWVIALMFGPISGLYAFLFFGIGTAALKGYKEAIVGLQDMMCCTNRWESRGPSWEITSTTECSIGRKGTSSFTYSRNSLNLGPGMTSTPYLPPPLYPPPVLSPSILKLSR